MVSSGVVSHSTLAPFLSTQFFSPRNFPKSSSRSWTRQDQSVAAVHRSSCLPCPLLPFPVGGEIRAAMDCPGRSCRLFGAQRSLHDLLGGGSVADVLLWRRKEVSGGLLAAVVASWALFYCVPGYTLLSFVSQVLTILLTVIFVWAKAAQLLNRALPPVPLLKISDKSTSEAAEIVGNFVNKVLQDFGNIALGKDSSLFYKVAFVLLLTSIVGRLTDLITLVYTSAVIALTIPALLEKSEEHIARFFETASTYVQTCGLACEEYKCKMTNRLLEKKLS